MNLPIGRDVRVGSPKADESPSSDTFPEEEKPNLSGLVTVTGFDSHDVLFRSNDVGTVQWRDSNGEVVALLVRLKPDIWGFSRRGDEDWEQVLERYGSQDT
jgi:hypothetical protein